MIVDIVRAKNETKDLRLSKTENCETLIKQNYTQAHKTFSFALNKPHGCRVFCEPEKFYYKKNKSGLNTITFYLEDDNDEEVDFNLGTLTFTLHLIKIWAIIWAVKTIKLIVIARVKRTILVAKTLWDG